MDEYFCGMNEVKVFIQSSVVFMIIISKEKGWAGPATLICVTHWNVQIQHPLFEKQEEKLLFYSAVSLLKCHGIFICYLTSS